MKRRAARKASERVGEEEPGYLSDRKGETSNVQRPTFNVQLGNPEATSVANAKYDLEERLLEYAVRIIRLVDALPPSRAGRHVSDQLLRCGTSPLANHGELQGAESRKDFIHKLGICLKEIRETRRWLRLIHRVPLLAPAKVEPLLSETEALVKIFSACVRTAEKNR
ncbi:MAG: four helix bundle protein [Chthoniobacterales bacterium]